MEDATHMVDTNSHQSIYRSGEYALKNPTWHIEHSPWKAKNILHMMKRNGISPRTICEVGCGAGEILYQLQNNMNAECEFDGYEISPQANSLSLEKANDKLRFHLEDFLNAKTNFDIILLIDLIEHLENYHGFLKEIHSRSNYKILNIPLELSFYAVLNPNFLQREYERCGHLHYFTKEIALRSLEHCGYRIIDWFYVHSLIEFPPKRMLGCLVKSVIQIATRINDDWAARIFGCNSLVVLAR